MLLRLLRRIAGSYWHIIVIILLTPAVFNILAISRTYGLHPSYQVAGASYNVWTGLLELYLYIAFFLLCFSVLTLALSHRAKLNDKFNVRSTFLIFFLVFISAFISGFGNLMIDIQWSSVLRDGVLGMSMSRQVYLNSALAFIGTACLLAYSSWRAINQAEIEV